ncbi:3-hydroxybutyryl-CoA dehydrogenase [Rhodococcus rhodochrous]|uniref:3-hydroxybutyryl-CoA dehydrogenase n=1 Tax=Rhodococcus rhodochrous KG-21 TaxID=1441923 RepID=A0A0M9WNC3_RHORH|nr:3-hydroxybutyryl-CoA dehydrogenase [Rhodococcus rhodochrous]KOS55417.1 3-hydroxybutyryl-CoA dehydrogenase [Rhodococcus rhodochrous KG-21]
MIIDQVGVVGGGLMGTGIARVCALAGADVAVCEVDVERAEAARARTERSLRRAAAADKITDADCNVALGRLHFTASLEDLAERDLVIEAIVEDERAKTDLFAALDKVVVSPSAVLASNTSSISITKLAAATTRPERVVGLHFFNPVPALRLVELVPTLHTQAATLDRVERFASDDLRKLVIRSQDRAGFVVNALLTPYLLSAVRMLEAGFASADDIDRGMVEGCAHPVGPLSLADFVGLDILLAASTSMYEEFRDPGFAPPPLLLRMVESGFLGEKTGRGFFTYS